MEIVLTRSQRAVFDFAKVAGAMDVPTSENLDQALRDLSRVMGSALIAGGMAVIHYGYERSTQDIDILYPNYDEADILRRLDADFKIVLKAESGWHHLEHRKTRVRLELIPEGGLTQYGFIPGPKVAGGHKGFVSLLGLIWMKLVSGRMKDDADIVEIAKAGKLSQMRKLTNKLPEELRERYEVLLNRAKTEIENDPNRNPNKGHRAEESPAPYGKRKTLKKASAKAKK